MAWTNEYLQARVNLLEQLAFQILGNSITTLRQGNNAEIIHEKYLELVKAVLAPASIIIEKD